MMVNQIVERIYDILSNYIQKRYEELYYGTEKTLDELIFAYENDFTPDWYAYRNEIPTDFVSRPNTVSTTTINEQLALLLDKFTIAVQLGNFSALQYADQLFSAIKDISINSDLQDALYGYVVDRLYLFIEPLTEELRKEIVEHTNPEILQKYYMLSMIVPVNDVVRYITVVKTLLTQIFGTDAPADETLAQIITDLSVYLASKFTDEPKSNFDKLLLWYKATDVDVIDYVHTYVLVNYAPIIDQLTKLILKKPETLTPEELSEVAEIDDMLQTIQKYLGNNVDLTDVESLVEFFSEISDTFTEYYETFLEETDDLESKLTFESYVVKPDSRVYTEAAQGYVTEFTIHEHRAERAGLHYDLRIRVGQKVMSIAFRKPIVALHKGEKRQGFIQPIHTKKWLTFEGEIKEGYGKGTLKIIAKGHAIIYKTGRGNIVVQFIDHMNSTEYWYAFIITEKDRHDKYHPVLLVPVDNKKESEHLYKPTIGEILEYFGYVPGSELMSISVDV